MRKLVYGPKAQPTTLQEGDVIILHVKDKTFSLQRTGGPEFLRPSANKMISSIWFQSGTDVDHRDDKRIFQGGEIAFGEMVEFIAVSHGFYWVSLDDKAWWIQPHCRIYGFVKAHR